MSSRTTLCNIRRARFWAVAVLVVVQSSLSFEGDRIRFVSRLGAQQRAVDESRRPGDATNRELITFDQVRSHPEFATALNVVEALHSNWMRVRNGGAASASARRAVPAGGRSAPGEYAGVQVYLDGHRLGGTELLRSIPARAIYSIRHLNGVEAQARFGIGHSEGVIHVATLPSFDRVW